MANYPIYSEGMKGQGPISQSQGIYEARTTAKAVLGTRVVFNDGRVFRYAKAATLAALAPGKFVTALGTYEANKAVAAAAAVGAAEVTITTAAAATSLAEGFLLINDAAGEGIMYKIKQGVANSTTAASSDLTLYDPIATALTTSSEATIIYSSYLDLVIASTTLTSNVIVGVPPITVAAGSYFWCQTWGLCPLLMVGDAAAAVPLTVSESIAGAGSTVALGTGAAGATIPTYGVMGGTTGVQTEYQPVFLTLAP